MSAVRVEPLGRENAPLWAALFERAASPCFCRWWHFEGSKNDWLARCAMTPETNRAEAEASIGAGSEEARGLVALADSQVVGWMKLAPRASLPKLRGLAIYRAYRAVELGSEDGVWSVGCFLVDPAYRHRGVAGALLDAAPGHARARGGVAIEAYPRHPPESDHGRVHDEQAWMGPEALFLSRGFARVADGVTPGMYPIYRLSLRPAP